MVLHLGMSRSLTLIFPDDAVIFAETLDILMGAHEALNDNSELQVLRGSWVKTKIQAFNDIFIAVMLSLHVCGEDIEVTERFTYLGSDIHVSACYEPVVNRGLDRAWGVMDSLDHGEGCCWYLCRRPKV